MTRVTVSTAPSGEPPVEIVEHKGVGHPDTLCDALAERLSVILSRYYLEHFGAVLHHNVDKALLWGGVSRPRFGGGDVLAPMEIYLAGRATREARGATIPVDELAVEGSRRWLAGRMHALDPARHVKIRPLIRPGSSELVEVFLAHAGTGVWLANDTSMGAGYAPLSVLERAVLAVGEALPTMTGASPEIGEDVKVLGLRRGEDIQLTVACAFVDRFVPSLAAYAERRTELARRVAGIAQQVTGREVPVVVNAADDLASGRAYLTVTGTSAEGGDDGQVGRGNRVNGLITPYRPMTLEAAAGKNPVSHVGKLYNVAAHRIAAAIVDAVPLVSYAECRLVSQIGRPVDEPLVVDVAVATGEGITLSEVAPRVEEIARDAVTHIPALWREILQGSVRLF